MRTTTKALIVLVLAGAVAGTLALKGQGKVQDETRADATAMEAPIVDAKGPAPGEESAEQAMSLPRLVDLGADKCVPCKMMAPLLAELREEYAGTFGVEFIDVWKNPGAGDKYGIHIIPTQIFYGNDGEELFRHEGFFSKEDILAVWKEHGVV